ncbi:hypothetical protein [Fonticella tunisiensis]|uniref:Uncharacterized protein n=1 Tax=Fonticella tunisiensis TaxID=1096341 RepID=A0A4R7KAB4_9CLOT|nr:hypothetical protein [Fonticella tunisiensis]TDT51296.1 hypothetical protein EDD71_11926 [Fonticella tunisiensis]
MEGIRISVQFKLRQPFFFSENYKEHINRFLIESGVKHFAFSDLLCIKQKKLNDGFYGLNKGRFDIATFINGDVINLVRKFSNEDMDLGNGTLPLSKINLSGIGYFSEGYMLSPVLVLDDRGESVNYFKNPVMFSESIRKKINNKIFRYL